MQKRKRQTITKTALEKKYLFKHYYSQTLKSAHPQDEQSTLRDLILASTEPSTVGTRIETTFESELTNLDKKLKQLKKESARRRVPLVLEQSTAQRTQRSGNTGSRLMKIVYFAPGYSKGLLTKNILTFEGKCLKVKNNGLHTKIILENPLNIIQQFCVYASNVLQLSIQTQAGVEILYTHPLFKQKAAKS